VQAKLSSLWSQLEKAVLRRADDVEELAETIRDIDRDMPGLRRIDDCFNRLRALLDAGKSGTSKKNNVGATDME
jgi:hypothetical protein